MFKALREVPSRIFNYTEMAEELRVDRHTIAGIVMTLVGLNIFKFVHKRVKNKMFQINKQINFRVVVERLKHLLGIYESLELSKEEWQRAMDFLIPLVLSSEQIRGYVQSFDGGTGEFLRTFQEDYIADRFGTTLPRGVKAPLTELFKKVADSGSGHFSRRFWETYL